MDQPEEMSTQRKVLVRSINLARSRLKASARASALLAGFAMVALVEIQIERDDTKPLPLLLLTLFVVNTSLLIGTHMVALMISTFLLPIIESYLSGSQFATSALVNEENESINDLHRYILASWSLSTVIGIFLFLVEIPLICWVKFWNYSSPNGIIFGLEHGRFVALITSIFIVPIVGAFLVVSCRFYRQLIQTHLKTTEQEMKSVEEMLKNFDKNRSQSFARQSPESQLLSTPLRSYNNIDEEQQQQINLHSSFLLKPMLPPISDSTDENIDNNSVTTTLKQQQSVGSSVNLGGVGS